MPVAGYGRGEAINPRLVGIYRRPHQNHICLAGQTTAIKGKGEAMTTDPETLRALVLSDLRRAQRLIVRTQAEELDPQFRIATPDGDYHIAMSFAPDIAGRLRQMELLKQFMSWKRALGFIVVIEQGGPDALTAVGMTPKQRCAARALIARPDMRFDEPVWLPRSKIGKDYASLLPRKPLTITPAMYRELDAAFGAHGVFPAIRITDGVMGL
jgi:hypothetical protein